MGTNAMVFSAKDSMRGATTKERLLLDRF